MCRNIVHRVAAAVALRPDRLEHAVEPAVQECVGVSFLRAMRVQLDEDIISDPGSQFHPSPHALRVGHILLGELARFHAGLQPLPPPDAQRTRYHQQIAPVVRRALKRHPGIVGLGFLRIIVGPVDRVHDAGLRGLRPGGHGEIGVAAQFAQQRDFIVQAAASAIRARIVQRPIAVNEAEHRLAVLAMQQPVAGVQGFHEAVHAVQKVLAALAVVVNVNLHFAAARMARFANGVQHPWLVFLLRIEECVLRRVALGIAVPPGDLRPPRCP